MSPDDWEIDDEMYEDHYQLSEAWSELHSQFPGSNFDLAIELGEVEAYYDAFANGDLNHDEIMEALHYWFVDLTGIYDEQEWDDKYGDD